ncbi:MAG: hypothetical protein JSV08_05365 [Acidobacteriota bacterium]|nr:MAG: hypothetical protein JSV08_05365 [Acidobacteriota bacterium]
MKKIWRVIKKPLLAVVWMVVGVVLTYEILVHFPLKWACLSTYHSAATHRYIRNLENEQIPYEVEVSVHASGEWGRELLRRYRLSENKHELFQFPIEEEEE